MRTLVAVAIVVASARAYAGAWYYKWSCSGQCAPNQLAISGVSAGYPTREMCEQDRWNDSRREEFLRPGNLGGLTSCDEYESPPAAHDNVGQSGSRRAVPLQRFGLGISSGSGWRVREGTTLAFGGSTLGIDMNFVGGPVPWIGIETGIGLQFSSVKAPHYGPDPKTLTFVPITLGLTSSPALVRGKKLEARLDLGADLGAIILTSCAECEADGMSPLGLVGQFRGGLDFYFGQKKAMGIALGATMMVGKLGNIEDEFVPSAIELVPPKYLLRVAFIGRNTDLTW